MNIKITKSRAEDIQGKFSTLRDDTDLQESYCITEDQADCIFKSIPAKGGEWNIPDEHLATVCEEMRDYAQFLWDQSEHALTKGEELAGCRFATWIENTFSAKH